MRHGFKPTGCAHWLGFYTACTLVHTCPHDASVSSGQGLPVLSRTADNRRGLNITHYNSRMQPEGRGGRGAGCDTKAGSVASSGYQAPHKTAPAGQVACTNSRQQTGATQHTPRRQTVASEGHNTHRVLLSIADAGKVVARGLIQVVELLSRQQAPGLLLRRACTIAQLQAAGTAHQACTWAAAGKCWLPGRH